MEKVIDGPIGEEMLKKLSVPIPPPT